MKIYLFLIVECIVFELLFRNTLNIFNNNNSIQVDMDTFYFWMQLLPIVAAQTLLVSNALVSY